MRNIFNKASRSLSAGVLLATLTFAGVQAQKADGDYAAKSLILTNPPEADYYFRTGDIDNLGFGWAPGYTPFSGKNTDSHDYPWDPASGDPAGTDRILLPSSYKQEAECGGDGYSSYYETNAASTKPAPIGIYCPLPKDLAGVQSAVLQLFIDDFQSPGLCSKFQVLLDGKTRAPYLEQLLDYIDQTGPVGKILAVKLPADHLKLLADSSLSVLIDDPTTGAGDGYAIDFIKLLVNPKPAFASHTSGPLRLLLSYKNDNMGDIDFANAKVEVLGWGTAPLKANADAELSISNLPVGLVVLKVTANGQVGHAVVEVSTDYDADTGTRDIEVYFKPKD